MNNDKVKSIIIVSENERQPNRIQLQENNWLWYLPLMGEELHMPIMITAYDQNGKKIYGKRY